MDISAPLRMSYLRPSTYYDENTNALSRSQSLPPLPTYDIEKSLHHHHLRKTITSAITSASRSEFSSEFSSGTTTPSATPIYPYPSTTDLSTSHPHLHPHRCSNPLTRIHRMLTIHPYNDMSYLASTIFIFSNGTFLLGNFFTVIPMAYPSLGNHYLSQYGIPVTLSVGLIGFDVSIALGFVTTFNVDRGRLEDDDGKEGGEGLGLERRYRPALIGSQEFVWYPSLSEFQTTYLPRPAFIAGLIQALGTLFYTISNISSEPSFLPSLKAHPPVLSNLLISFPILFGSVCFLITSMILMQITQSHWWKPRLGDANWWSLGASALGAVGLIVGAGLQFGGKAGEGEGRRGFEIALFALLGRAGFWLGNLGRLYVLMEFYPS